MRAPLRNLWVAKGAFSGIEERWAALEVVNLVATLSTPGCCKKERK
jgi:hypothetical protein